jgi:hypothetical protein
MKTISIPHYKRINVLVTATILILSPVPALAVPITVVDVIPNNQSFETDPNSEPSIAVDPNNTQIAVISAFSGFVGQPNPPSVPLQPYYATSNGGKDWSNFTNIPHGDTTLAWSTSNNEYMTRLFQGATRIQVQQDVPPYPPFTFFNTTGNSTITAGMVGQSVIDQPVISVNNPGNGGPGNDHIYVGYNDYSTFANMTRTFAVARLMLSADGGTTWNNAAPLILDPTVNAAGPTSDGNHVVSAAVGNTVYVAYERYSGGSANGGLTGNIIVRRDDGGANTFVGLNGANGQAVLAANRSLTFNGAGAATLGRERLGSDITIAVDPRDATGKTVYLAFADTVAGNVARINLTASTDGGTTWTVPQSLPNNTALPVLSVTRNGTIGLEYSSLSGTNLQTHLRELGFNTVTKQFDTLADFTISTFDQTSVPFTLNPFIGDYEGLVSVDDTFFGTFSASSAPDPADFPDPNSVIFDRNVLYFLSPCGNGVFFGDSDLKVCGDGQLVDTNGIPLRTNTIDAFFFSISAVPEPSTLTLMAAWVIVLVLLASRRESLAL